MIYSESETSHTKNGLDWVRCHGLKVPGRLGAMEKLCRAAKNNAPLKINLANLWYIYIYMLFFSYKFPPNVFPYYTDAKLHFSRWIASHIPPTGQVVFFLARNKVNGLK